jgi:hypothetical protein
LVLLLLEVENCSSLLFPLAGVLLVLDDILIMSGINEVT